MNIYKQALGDEVMKRISLVLLPLLIALLLLGCMGRDGKDGKVYLKIRLLDCNRYWDNNPSIPYGFSTEVYYSSSAGYYNFEFSCTDGSEWTGNYSLSKNYGESGGFLYNGDNGRDRFYTLTCSFAGPSLTYYEDGKYKQVIPLSKDEESLEIIHEDGAYKIHINAIKNSGQSQRRNPKY